MAKEPKEDPWAFEGGRRPPGLITWLTYVIPAVVFIGAGVYYLVSRT